MLLWMGGCSVMLIIWIRLHLFGYEGKSYFCRFI